MGEVIAYYIRESICVFDSNPHFVQIIIIRRRKKVRKEGRKKERKNGRKKGRKEERKKE